MKMSDILIKQKKKCTHFMELEMHLILPSLND